MAITQVGTTTTSTTTDPSATLTITKPSGGVAVGDVLIAGITSNNDTQVATGWTKFDGQTLDPTTLWQVNLYYKVAVSGDVSASNYSFTVGTGGPSAGFITAWRGVDTGT